MEILFQNSYVRNEKIVKEMFRYLYFQRKFYKVLLILHGIVFFINLFLFLEIKDYEMLWVLSLGPLLIFFIFLCYFSQVNATLKRDREICENGVEVDILVMEDWIQTAASTGAVTKLEYNKIRSAFETKNLILLRTRANLIYTFPKDKFTVGDAEDFISFLKEKGIRVR